MAFVLTFVALIATSSFVSSYDIRCFRPNQDHDVITLIHPEDCRKFYKCDETFNVVEQSCPPLLEFDPVLKICDWPKGYCTADKKPVDSVMNCNGLPENTYLADYENDCRSFFYCKNGVTRIGRCIPETRFDSMSQMCIDENLVDCYLPTDISKRGNNFLNKPYHSNAYDDPMPQKFPNYGKSCQTYFICQNGHCREENCYFGKIFDSITKQCVTDAYCHESYTIGRVQGRASPSYIDCSVKQGRWYPDEDDCTKFYICANGTAYRQQCLVRQYFERKRGICKEGSTETCQPDPGPECKCSCGSYKDGDRLPDLFYSTKYYICQSGVLKSMTCENGLDFDAESLKCVGEDGETTPEITTPEITTPIPNLKTCGYLAVGETIPDEFGTGSFYYICTEGGILKRVECEDDNVYQNGKCSPPIITPPPTGDSCGPLRNGELLPDDFNDSMFYVCSDGYLNHKTCPTGQTFDKNLLVCKTGAETTPPPKTTAIPGKNCGPTPEGGFVPDSFDNTKFYVCVQGVLERKSCPVNYIFDAIKLQCTTNTPTTAQPCKNCGAIPEGGFVPDLNDESKFYVCVDGKLLPRSCPEGAKFDPEIQQCTGGVPIVTPEIKNCGPTPDGGFLPDLFDRKKFYVCVQGVLLHRSCPEGSEFSEKNLQCETIILTTTSTSTTVSSKNCGPVPNGAFIPDEFDNAKFYVCINGVLEHKNCPENTYFDKINLVCTSTQPTSTLETKSCGNTPQGGFIPDKFDKSKFYVCIDGKLRQLSCPTGQIFDESLLICTSSQVTTTTTTLVPESGDCGPTSNGGFLPDEFDNSKFYVCVDGRLRHLSCPVNHIFNKDKLRCEECSTTPTTPFSTTVTATPSTTTTTTTPFTTTTTTAPSTTTITATPSTTSPSSTTTTTTPPPKSGCGTGYGILPYGDVLPDKFDEKAFYVCLPPGVLNRLNCPENTVFSVELKRCHAPSGETTTKISTTPTITTTTTTIVPSGSCGSVTDGERLPDKFNNAKFYVCVQGVLWHMTCPVDQIFDETLLMCIASSTTSIPTRSCGSLAEGGFIPDKFNNTWHYVCFDGVLQHKQCPLGQFFDPELLICNAPSTSSTTTMTTTTPLPTTTTSIPTTSLVTTIGTSAETSTTTSSPNGCGPLKEGDMLPDEFYINKYYICVNGFLNQHTCPTGLIFDKVNLYCYNCTVEPSSTTTEEPSGNCGSLSTGDMIPGEYDKHKFYICIDGYLKHLECANDTIFDPQTSTCIQEKLTTTTSATTSTTNGESTPTKGCGNLKPDGIIPDEFDRHKFYICSGDYMEHIACPGDLVFDPSTLSCKLEEGTTTTTQSTSTSSTSTTTSTTTTTTTTPRPTTTLSTSTTSTTTGKPNEFCPGGIPPDAVLPNDKNCQAFITCTNGELVDELCEEGFYFDKSTTQCVVNTGQCVPPVVTPAPGCGIIENGEFMPNFFDNTKFFICVNGELIPQTCDSGQVFDTAKSICISRQPTTSAPTTASTTTQSTQQLSCGTLKSGDFLPDFGNSKYFFVCISGLLEQRVCPANQIFDKAELTCVSVVPQSIPAVVAPVSQYLDCGVVKNGEFLPNNHDKAKYYICLNGILTPQACGIGQIFKAEGGICIGEDLAIANEPMQITQIPGKRACKDMQPGAHISHETDATKYYVCVLNMLQEEQCPPGHTFDPNELYCKFVWN